MALKTSNMRLADGGGTSAPKKNTSVMQNVINHYNGYTNKLFNQGKPVSKSKSNTGTVTSGGSNISSLSNQPVANSESPTQQSPTNTTQANSTQTNSTNNSYQEYLNKIFSNAQNAYNNNLNAINSMYSDRMNSLNSRYNSGRDTLSATNEQQQEALRKAKEQAQRQAYIQSQVAERDMQQNLSAQGLSGGASESTLASMRNNYASNRNSNEEEYLNNAASLNASYQSELANLENQYQQLIDALNAEKANAIMQNENALANAGTATINQFADYAYNMDYLKENAAFNQQAQERQAELNDYYSAKQDARDYANKVNLIQAENAMKQSSNNNAILSAIKSRLRNAGYSEEQILQIVGE